MYYPVLDEHGHTITQEVPQGVVVRCLDTDTGQHVWRPVGEAQQAPAAAPTAAPAPTAEVALPGPMCPYCRTEVAAGATGALAPYTCAGCGVTYHAECWHNNGERCAVYGCRSREAQGTAEAPAEAEVVLYPAVGELPQQAPRQEPPRVRENRTQRPAQQEAGQDPTDAALQALRAERARLEQMAEIEALRQRIRETQEDGGEDQGPAVAQEGPPKPGCIIPVAWFFGAMVGAIVSTLCGETEAAMAGGACFQVAGIGAGIWAVARARRQWRQEQRQEQRRQVYLQAQQQRQQTAGGL